MQDMPGISRKAIGYNVPHCLEGYSAVLSMIQLTQPTFYVPLVTIIRIAYDVAMATCDFLN